MHDEMVAERFSHAETRPVIVVLVAPKGGVGKTTTASTLLVSARRSGLSALGIDMDEQEGLAAWSARRDRLIARNPSLGVPDVPVRKMDPSDWRKLLAVRGYDMLVVDTRPGLGDAWHAIRSICESASIVLMPTSPSFGDLDKVVPFGRAMGLEKAFFVLNRVNRRTISWGQARADLTRGTRLAPSDIPSLEVIQTQFGLGLATTDNGSRGSEGFVALWNFVRMETGLPPEEDARG